MAFSWQNSLLLLIILALINLINAATVQVSNCDGYTSPAGCTKGINCAFEASWRVYEADAPPSDPNGNRTQAALFTVKIRRPSEKSSSFYTAIGFSDHQAMPDTDVAIGYVYNNNFLEVVDAYIEPGQIKPPTIDQQQDVYNYTGSLVDAQNDRTKRVLTFTFTRRLDTGDATKDISLTQCRYFFFVTGGGTVSGPRNFYKHDVTPDISSEKICLTKCLTPSAKPSSSNRCAWSWIFMAMSILITILKF